MLLPRFYLAPAEWASSQLSEADTHHCAKVLRMTVGDALVIFDGKGGESQATITAFSKVAGHYRGALSLGPRSQTAPPSCQITLAQGVPKAKSMDWILQKAVELGASRIVPLLTERTLLRCHDDADARHKQERWSSIAIEACKQCGQNWLPMIEQPCTPENFFKKSDPSHLLLIASLQEQSFSLKKIVASLPHLPTHVTIMIGPEGDFTAAESAAAQQHGYQSITLGPIVLRSETAAIYCLSVLSHQLL
ncbi:MAG: 16S rRNA (uracil(1498)-N(3))-methyltransferase [Chthoniobacterales bacterium]|nr:16S rRNA (uracil(1498)-N(3))-methyltransferase [Chthoniobacterales bacterium]